MNHKLSECFFTSDHSTIHKHKSPQFKSVGWIRKMRTNLSIWTTSFFVATCSLGFDKCLCKLTLHRSHWVVCLAVDSDPNISQLCTGKEAKEGNLFLGVFDVNNNINLLLWYEILWVIRLQYTGHEPYREWMTQGITGKGERKSKGSLNFDFASHYRNYVFGE